MAAGAGGAGGEIKKKATKAAVKSVKAGKTAKKNDIGVLPAEGKPVWRSLTDKDIQNMYKKERATNIDRYGPKERKIIREIAAGEFVATQTGDAHIIDTPSGRAELWKGKMMRISRFK